MEKQPQIISVKHDDETHSHWALIDPENGKKLWSENPKECQAQGYPVYDKDYSDLTPSTNKAEVKDVQLVLRAQEYSKFAYAQAPKQTKEDAEYIQAVSANSYIQGVKENLSFPISVSETEVSEKEINDAFWCEFNARKHKVFPGEHSTIAYCVMVTKGLLNRAHSNPCKLYPQSLSNNRVEVLKDYINDLRECRITLNWLLALKQEKDKNGKTEKYLEQMPKAWDKTRRFMEVLNNKDYCGNPHLLYFPESSSSLNKENPKEEMVLKANLGMAKTSELIYELSARCDTGSIDKGGNYKPTDND